MNAAQAWSLILGFATPLLVSVVTKSSMQPWLKQVIAIVTSVLVGIINLVVQGSLNNMEITLGNILTVIAAVIGAASAAYTLLWKPTGVAENVEAKINGDPGGTVTDPNYEGGYTTATMVLVVLGIIALILVILYFLGVHVNVG